MSTLIIKNARLSFDKNLVTPTEPKGNKPPKRSCNLIVSDDTQFALLEDGKSKPIKREDLQGVLESVLKAKFNGKVPAKWENWAVRENSTAVNASSGERYSGYEDDKGIYFAPTRFVDHGPPAYVRRDKSLMDSEKPADLAEIKRLLYGGCYVNAKINIGAYETKEDGVTKRGVTTYLEAVQHFNHGEKFGGGSANNDGFEALPDIDEEEEEEITM
jgi:hypothetical protein